MVLVNELGHQPEWCVVQDIRDRRWVTGGLSGTKDIVFGDFERDLKQVVLVAIPLGEVAQVVLRKQDSTALLIILDGIGPEVAVPAGNLVQLGSVHV